MTTTVNKQLVDWEHQHQQLFMTEDGLPPSFAKLFIARQKDLQVSRNIELQLARFTQLVLE